MSPEQKLWIEVYVEAFKLCERDDDRSDFASAHANAAVEKFEWQFGQLALELPEE